jgi:hypothetical protein
MNGMKILMNRRLGWLAAVIAAVVGATAILTTVQAQKTALGDVFDRALYDSYLASGVRSESEIVEDYEWNQVLFMPLLLPDTEQVLTQPGGLLPVTDGPGSPSSSASVWFLACETGLPTGRYG